MLVDYIPPEKLPWVVVWLDWHIYANKFSLFFFIVSFIVFYFSQTPVKHWSISGSFLPVYVGFSAWCVYCYFRHGGAVG